MLKRKITDELIKWKNKKGHMCLLVKGARQVGKTFSIVHFAKEHYKYFVHINFDETPRYKSIFENDLDVDTLTKQISLRVPNAKLIPKETVIFLDEIQNCPEARTALKFFAIDGRFDVIASGSMLGVNYNKVPSFPVGYVDYIDMYSLDFEEYLWANGISDQSIQDIRDYYENKEPVPQAMHEKMLELFREHIVVGGMPRVVDRFMSSKNFADVLDLQRGIIRDYTDDIAKYADGTEKVKARECFLSIPKHLSKDYKKFRYSLVEKNGTARKFGGSLMWLYDAGIINFCYNLAAPELPLEGNAKSDIFKVYMKDTGLLVAMLEDGSQEDIISGDLGIYKGAVYENIIADVFSKNGKKLYYFERNSRIEIDFFIRYNKMATAVEVKSAGNTKSKSMVAAIENYNLKQGIKLSTKNVGVRNNVISLPLYMSMFL